MTKMKKLLNFSFLNIEVEKKEKEIVEKFNFLGEKIKNIDPKLYYKKVDSIAEKYGVFNRTAIDLYFLIEKFAAYNYENNKERGTHFYCYASSEYLAKKFHRSRRTIQHLLCQLEEMKMIFRVRDLRGVYRQTRRKIYPLVKLKMLELETQNLVENFVENKIEPSVIENFVDEKIEENYIDEKIVENKPLYTSCVCLDNIDKKEGGKTTTCSPEKNEKKHKWSDPKNPFIDYYNKIFEKGIAISGSVVCNKLHMGVPAQSHTNKELEGSILGPNSNNNKKIINNTELAKLSERNKIIVEAKMSTEKNAQKVEQLKKEFFDLAEKYYEGKKFTGVFKLSAARDYEKAREHYIRLNLLGVLDKDAVESEIEDYLVWLKRRGIKNKWPLFNFLTSEHRNWEYAKDNANRKKYNKNRKNGGCPVNRAYELANYIEEMDLFEYETKRDLENKPFIDEFEKVFEAYPLKIDKKQALEAYIAQRKNGKSYEKILSGAKNYADYVFGADLEPRYIKHCANWLKNECWLDQHPENNSTENVYPDWLQADDLGIEASLDEAFETEEIQEYARRFEKSMSEWLDLVGKNYLAGRNPETLDDDELEQFYKELDKEKPI